MEFDKIIQKRKEAGITLFEVAKKMNLCESRIWRLENQRTYSISKKVLANRAKQEQLYIDIVSKMIVAKIKKIL